MRTYIILYKYIIIYIITIMKHIDRMKIIVGSRYAVRV